MRKLPLILALLLPVGSPAFAQVTAATPGVPPGTLRWDLNFSAGFFQARPEEGDAMDYDDWYSEGRYAVGLGYYWTKHFKTELEFAHSPEGSRYVQEFSVIPGGQPYPYNFEKFYRIQQTSLRAVWQFHDNAWVHPYVNGGLVFEAERHHYFVPQQFRFPPDPRGTPVLLRPEINSEKTTDYRGGATVGGGAKFYVSPSAYINTGMQITYARPSTTVSFIAGFGIDF